MVRERAETYPLPAKTASEVDEILSRLRAGLERLYGERLGGVYLFGSYARGEAVSGSDLDVLVVLSEIESSWKEIQRTSELTADLSLEFDITVCSLFTTEQRWKQEDSAFLQNVRREGIAV